MRFHLPLSKEERLLCNTIQVVVSGGIIPAMQKKKASGPIPNKRLREQRELRGWTQEKLAEEVEASAVTVSRWESGILPSLYHRRKLCELFGKSPQELGFIREGIDEESNATSLRTLLWPPTIPDEPYYPLPGREQDVNLLLMALQDAQGPLCIAIDGLGGLGKTSLAVDLARRALRQQLFEGVIGDSAQQELFTGGEIIQVREVVLDFDHLLDALARQLGRWELPTLKEEEKRVNLARLLRQHRYLILVDNLETAENAAALVAHLRGLLGTSRAIVTSRQQVRHDFVQALSLKELDLEDALLFLTKRHAAARRTSSAACV